MAVPAGQRSENKLEVLERAQRFAIHLIEVTANTKKFPGRFAPIVTRMCDTAWEIAENIYTANKVYIGDSASTCNSQAHKMETYYASLWRTQ